MSPQRSSSPWEIIHGVRGKLPPPRRLPKLPGYVSPFQCGRFATLNGSAAKFGPCATCCVSRVCSAQRPPNLTTLIMPPEGAPHSPSTRAYFSSSLVLAGLAPKIQSSVVPVNTDVFTPGNATSTGEPTPWNV